jgi:hypothetical protein
LLAFPIFGQAAAPLDTPKPLQDRFAKGQAS